MPQSAPASRFTELSINLETQAKFLPRPNFQAKLARDSHGIA
jgi:hypothetical protein